MANLKQVTSYVRTFLMIQSSDHITGLTAASPTLNLSMAGAAFASTNAVIAELGNGYYKASLTSTDTRTLGDLAFHFTAASADPTDFIDQVTLNILGDTLPANVTQWSGTNVSGPATAGIPDVNMKNVNNVVAATPGATGGILIAGTNAATTFNAGVVISNAGGDALQLTSSGSNGNALNATANGSGTGIIATGGATGHGASLVGGATSGQGLRIAASGDDIGLNVFGHTTGHAVQLTAGATGFGLNVKGGATSGIGIQVLTTSGDAVAISPTAGHGINIVANGTSKHGITSTGGTAGTSDGIKGVAGTGGVDIRGNITGNITGTLATLTTYTGNTPQTGDAFLRLGAPAGASIAADLAEIEGETDTLLAGVIVTTNNDKTGYALTAGERTSIAAAAWTTAQSESYSALHANPTPIQMLYQSRAFWEEKSVSGTSVTVLQIDGATTAMTFSLDSTSPTKISRAA
jgi:hypothetical protein